MLRPFRLLTPTTVAETSTELGRLGDQAKVYAGGAELILLMRHGVVRADYLIDIKKVPGLGDISWDGTRLRIGAIVTHRRLETDPLVATHLPILAEAESHIGNVRVRNQGTLGGNLCFADPHADPGTALLVHDASVRLEGANGARETSLADFMVGTYETGLEPDELLTEVLVPPLPHGWNGAFLRLEQFYRPTLNVAAALRAEDGRIGDVRLAVGCVSPKPLRLDALESRLKGLPLGDAERLIDEGKAELAELLEPVDDLLGSAAYKIHVTTVLLRRALTQAAQTNGRGDHA